MTLGLSGAEQGEKNQVMEHLFSCVRSIWVRLLATTTWSGAKVRVPKAPSKPGSWGTAKTQARLESGVSIGLPGCVRFQRTPNPSEICPEGPRVKPGPGEWGTPGVHTPRESHSSISTNSPDGDNRDCLHWEGAPSQGFNALGWGLSQGSALPVGACELSNPT